MAEEALSLLDLRGTETVLDIGCGNGRATGEIAARLPRGRIVGVDASARMIAFARERGFRVLRTHAADKSWDFQSRAAFTAFASVTFVEWTQHLPEAARLDFINDVLDRYQKSACTQPGEENFFRFYQMDIILSPS